jgi:hypothetical protein
MVYDLPLTTGVLTEKLPTTQTLPVRCHCSIFCRPSLVTAFKENGETSRPETSRSFGDSAKSARRQNLIAQNSATKMTQNKFSNSHQKTNLVSDNPLPA